MAKKKRVKVARKKPKVPFEEAIGRLEQIVADLEEGDLSLENSLDRYEEGVGLLRSCSAQLEDAQRRIEILSGVDAEGNPITAVFEDEETDDSLEAKAAGRSRRRTANSGGSDDFKGESTAGGDADDDLDDQGLLF